jgi:CubicO group peptidase (beta-lactamase class C family)
MRFKALLLAALVAAAPLPALAQTADPASLDSEIDTILRNWMAENHIPGMVFGVVKDGRLAYVKS